MCFVIIVHISHAQQLFHDVIDVPQYWERSDAIKKLPNEDLAMISRIDKTQYFGDEYSVLHRIDQNGNVQFHRAYAETSQRFYAWRNMEVGNFGYLITGQINDLPKHYQHLVKLHPDGSFHWAKKYKHQAWQGEIHDAHLNGWFAIEKISEELFVVTGAASFLKENQQKYYAHFATIDLDGNVHESNLLDLTSYTDQLTAIQHIKKVGNSFIATGYLSNQGTTSMLIVKLDANLQVNWMQEVTTEKFSIGCRDILVTSNTDFILLGTHDHVFSMKMDLSGQIAWVRSYKWADGNAFAGQANLDQHGNIYITGYAEINKYFAGTDFDLFVLKTNSQGILSDVQHFGKDGVDEYTTNSVRMNSGLITLFGSTNQNSRCVLSVSTNVPFVCEQAISTVSMIDNDYGFTPLEVEQRPTYTYTESIEYEILETEYDLDPCGHIDYGELETPFLQPVLPQIGEEFIQEFTAYPNPSADEILISWKNVPNREVHKVRIQDLSGRMIHSEKVNNKSEIKYRLPDPGMYILLASDLHNRILFRTKVIKH